MDNEVVECTECGDIHAWCERTVEYEKEFCWTIHRCPKCGEESYYPVNTKDFTLSRTAIEQETPLNRKHHNKPYTGD